MSTLLSRALAHFSKQASTSKADIEKCCRFVLFGLDDGSFKGRII